MNFATDFAADSNGIPRLMLNGNAYVNPLVPTLYTALSAPAQSLNNPIIYGTGVNPYIISYGAIVEIDVTNHDDRAHSFHLHGHHFQIINCGSGGSFFPGLDSTPAIPLRRDTIVVYGGDTATIRFVADNPSIQLFHCHTEWRVVGGMTATFIEAPTELVAQKLYIPASHRQICDNYGILRTGNAAGNSVNWLNLTGAPTQAPSSNWG
jgi:iron transport multicopper oxidase